jgi:8-oxo-dGTP pyrophosphatase MutT (NUDIX family)
MRALCQGPGVHRASLLALLDAFAARHPEDHVRTARFRDFVERHPDCLLRSCVPGHLTASAWIVSEDRSAVLLVRHRKLGRWLQPGGHADGDADLAAVALREAREETGLTRLVAADPLPFDVDVHEIPAHGIEPAHLHYDVRFVIVAAREEVPCASSESTAIAWVQAERLEDVTTDESVLRMHRRSRTIPE